MDGRPRRVPFEYEYKNNREREKERERENNIDPFGLDNPDFLNPSNDIGEENKKPGKETVSWLDDVDNLPLPSRTFYNERNDFLNIHKHDRNENLNENKIHEELELEKIKSNRLQSELNRLKNIKETLNSKSLLQFINKISFNSLGLGKKIGQGGFSEIYESQWLGIPVAVKVIFDPKITEALLEEFNNEIEKLFILRHPYIIQLYGITDKDKSQKLAVITELAPKGSLFD